MTYKTLISAGVALTALAITSAASAATVRLTDFSGEWRNVVGGTNVNFVGNPSNNPEIYWGTTSGDQSGYRMDFAPNAQVADPIDHIVPPDTDPFRIGGFTHENWPIRIGTSITSVDLRITFEILIDSGMGFVSQGYRSFDFLFSHLETDNSRQPCADGGNNGEGVNSNGCADRVQISPLSTSETFVVDGIKYTFDLVGFSSDENCSIITSEFWTVERQTNEACLFAQIRSAEIAPEPGSLALLGLGLLGLGLSRRKLS